MLGQVAEIDVLHGLFGAGVGGEVDELRHEVTELREFDLRGVDQLGPLRFVE